MRPAGSTSSAGGSRLHVDIGASRHPSHLPMVVQIHVCAHPRGTGPYTATRGDERAVGSGLAVVCRLTARRVYYALHIIHFYCRSPMCVDMFRYSALTPAGQKRMSGFVQRYGPPSKTDGRFWQGLSATPRPKRVQLFSSGKTDVSFCQPAKPISGFFRRYVPPNKQIYFFLAATGSPAGDVTRCFGSAGVSALSCGAG
jgi:hypothetical protein